MFSVDQVCTGDTARIRNALQSFPSGHSEIAFAGLGYLAIYLFTHLGIGDRSNSSRAGFWRVLAVIAPILLATYIACTLVLGYHHHAHDCFFGAAIGMVTAVLGYRVVFRSLVDGGTNWKPRIGRRAKRAASMERSVDELEDGLGGRRRGRKMGLVKSSSRSGGALARNRRREDASVQVGETDIENENGHDSPV